MAKAIDFMDNFGRNGSLSRNDAIGAKQREVGCQPSGLTDAMPPSPAGVISNLLTPAQRAKLNAIGDGKPAEYPLGHAGHALIRMGLVYVNELGARHLPATSK